MIGDNNPAKRLEVRKKISEKLKGRYTPWLIGDKNPAKRPEVREKIRNNVNSIKTRFGNKPSWNKGIKIDRVKYPNIGHCKPHTEETRMKLKRYANSPEALLKSSRIALNNIEKGKWVKVFNTKPERLLKILLSDAGLQEKKDFIHQKRIGKYVFDFYLPAVRLVIEADGEYWHTRPETMMKDKEKEEYLKENKYNLLRFWDYEIYQKPDMVKNKILNFLVLR